MRENQEQRRQAFYNFLFTLESTESCLIPILLLFLVFGSWFYLENYPFFLYYFTFIISIFFLSSSYLFCFICSFLYCAFCLRTHPLLQLFVLIPGLGLTVIYQLKYRTLHTPCESCQSCSLNTHGQSAISGYSHIIQSHHALPPIPAFANTQKRPVDSAHLTP
jgi:hypothetical protein